MLASFSMFGVSFRSAPLSVRERLSVIASKKDSSRQLHARLPSCQGIVVLSTCNRVEVYAQTSDIVQFNEAMQAWILDSVGHDVEMKTRAISNLVYNLGGADALKHLFRVSSSLDSMVLGEPQILGQVKEAYRQADKEHTLSPVLRHCFEHAFSVAKRVRTESGLGAGTVSVSSMAVELAQHVFNDLNGTDVLLIGAGEMAESAAKALRRRRANINVINRTHANAQALLKRLGLEEHSHAADMSHLEACLLKSDVLLCSTSSHTHVLKLELLKSVMHQRANRPLFILDIALPRDVDPSIGALPNVYLYNVDDLQQLASREASKRADARHQAESLVEGALSGVSQEMESRSMGVTIKAFRNYVQQSVRDEMNAVRASESSVANLPDEAFDKLCRTLANKLSHKPSLWLRANPSLLGSEKSPILNGSQPTISAPQGDEGSQISHDFIVDKRNCSGQES